MDFFYSLQKCGFEKIEFKKKNTRIFNTTNYPSRYHFGRETSVRENALASSHT